VSGSDNFYQVDIVSHFDVPDIFFPGQVVRMESTFLVLNRSIFMQIASCPCPDQIMAVQTMPMLVACMKNDDQIHQ